MAAGDMFPDILVGMDSKPGKKVNMDVVEFGDGYEQTSENGINATKRTWDVVFDNISLADLATIEAFLAGRESVPFRWLPPTDTLGEGELAPLWKVVNGTWKPTFPSAVRANLSVSFRECFDIV
jgi:phage-related protein